MSPEGPCVLRNSVSSDLNHTRALHSPHFRLNPCHIFQKQVLRNHDCGQIHKYAASKTSKFVDSVFAALTTPKERPAFSGNSLCSLSFLPFSSSDTIWESYRWLWGRNCLFSNMLLGDTFPLPPFLSQTLWPALALSPGDYDTAALLCKSS